MSEKLVWIVVCLTIVAGIIQQEVFAQNDFAPVGAKWNFQEVSLEGPELYNRTIESVAGTTIQGIECRRLVGTSGCSEILNPYIYSEDNKVFYFNTEADTFFLLYDFGLNPNESWTIYFTAWSSELDSITVTVTDTSSIVVNGINLKVQSITQTGFNYYLGSSIIERIGCVDFLYPQYGACDPPTGRLICYNDSVIGLYETGLAPSCDYTNVGINESEIQIITLFPNPASTQLTLQTPNPGITSYTINDIQGRQLQSGSFTQSTTLDVNTLAQGVYLIRFQHQGNSATYKFVKQ